MSNEEIQTVASRIVGTELHPVQVEWVREMIIPNTRLNREG